MAKKRERRGPTLIQQSRSVPSEQKAMYHQVLGAGRRGVMRQFFDLNDEDQKALGTALERSIAGRIGARRS